MIPDKLPENLDDLRNLAYSVTRQQYADHPAPDFDPFATMLIVSEAGEHSVVLLQDEIHEAAPYALKSVEEKFGPTVMYLLAVPSFMKQINQETQEVTEFEVVIFSGESHTDELMCYAKVSREHGRNELGELIYAPKGEYGGRLTNLMPRHTRN